MKLGDKMKRELQRRRWDYDNVLIPTVERERGNPEAYTRPGSLKK